MTLRPITPADYPFVLALNELNVEKLSSLDEGRLTTLLGWADRGDVIEHEGRSAGFVLTFAAGSAYDGVNFGWFANNLDAPFYYLDRIALDDRFQRLGIGNAAYDELEAVATAYGRMVLEVNIEPPNQPSLDFHRGRGYAEVGRLGENGKQVALLAKTLGTH